VKGYSQAGQDLHVLELLGHMHDGFFVEAGAHDGITASNTFLMEKDFGWDGICVEARDECFSKLRASRDCICVQACLDSEPRDVQFIIKGGTSGILSSDCDNQKNQRDYPVQSVRTCLLADILDEWGAPAEMDYLSLDVEGAEERVLSVFPFDRYRFRVMTIERPSARLIAQLENAGYTLKDTITHKGKPLDGVFVWAA
jgi:FkbM family methyltransferase